MPRSGGINISVISRPPLHEPHARRCTTRPVLLTKPPQRANVPELRGRRGANRQQLRALALTQRQQGSLENPRRHIAQLIRNHTRSVRTLNSRRGSRKRHQLPIIERGHNTIRVDLRPRVQRLTHRQHGHTGGQQPVSATLILRHQQHPWRIHTRKQVMKRNSSRQTRLAITTRDHRHKLRHIIIEQSAQHLPLKRQKMERFTTPAPLRDTQKPLSERIKIITNKIQRVTNRRPLRPGLNSQNVPKSSPKIPQCGITVKVL